jgi:ethanolamine utilization protein EutN
MLIAVVQGHVTSTVKHASLHKGALLIVQPVNVQTGRVEGLPQVAVDTLGAGPGQRVLLSNDGRGTMDMLGGDRTCPVRLAVVGIVTAADTHAGRNTSFGKSEV